MNLSFGMYIILSHILTMSEEDTKVTRRSLLGLRNWLTRDTYGMVMRRLNKFDLAFVYLAYGSKRKLPWGIAMHCAMSNYVACLRYLHEELNNIELKYKTSELRLGHEEIRGAACEGHLECIKYLHGIGCPLPRDALWEALRIGNLECAQYLVNNGVKWNIDDSDMINVAAFGGNIGCVELIHKYGEQWDYYTTAAAATAGRLYMLQYLREKGCEWNLVTSARAADAGMLDILQYLHENDCKWDSSTTNGAANNGHLDCLKYAIDNGCDYSTAVRGAVYGGQLECLKYLHQIGCELVPGDTDAAANRGRLEVLEYLHQNGCEWGENVCRYAAKESNFDCLKYAIDNGCKIDEKAASVAALLGRLDCLKYILENGGVWIKPGRIARSCIEYLEGLGLL